MIIGIAVGAIVGGVIIGGATYDDYSDWSEYGNWEEVSPRDKYRKEIREAEHTIEKLHQDFKVRLEALCEELEIDPQGLNFPNFKSLLQVDADENGVFIQGYEELREALKELEENLSRRVQEALAQQFGEELERLKLKQKKIIDLINRINEIRLYRE